MAHRNILLRIIGAMTSPNAQKELNDLYTEYQQITKILLRKWWVVLGLTFAGTTLGFFVASQKVLLKATEASVPFLSLPTSGAKLHDSILSPEIRLNAANDLLSSVLRDRDFAKDFSLGFFSYFRSRSENQAISSEDWKTLQTFLNINNNSISEDQAVEILADYVSADVFITPQQSFTHCRAIFCLRVLEIGKLNIFVTTTSEGKSKPLIEAIVLGLEKASVAYNTRTSMDRELSARKWNQELINVSAELRDSRSDIIEQAVKIRQSLILLTKGVSPEEKIVIMENPLRNSSSASLKLPEEFVINLKWHLQVFYEDGRISRQGKSSLDQQIQQLEISLLKYNTDFAHFGSQVLEYRSLFNNKHEFLPVINQQTGSASIFKVDQGINDKKREFVFYPLLGAFSGIILSFVLAAALLLGFQPNQSTIQTTYCRLDPIKNNE